MLQQLTGVNVRLLGGTEGLRCFQSCAAVRFIVLYIRGMYGEALGLIKYVRSGLSYSLRLVIVGLDVV